MFYLYTPDGYVREIAAELPPQAQRQNREVVEVSHPNTPTEGFWRVENGMLVEVPVSFEFYENHKERVRARRAPR